MDRQYKLDRDIYDELEKQIKKDIEERKLFSNFPNTIGDFGERELQEEFELFTCGVNCLVPKK